MSTPGLNMLLYVDDEPDIREIVEMALGMLDNVSIRTCGSGEQALRILQQVKPDLILLDVMMPGMDGPTTLKNIRAQPGFGAVPIAFMTAKALREEVDRFKQLGAIDVIAKPFDPMQLAPLVTAIWNAHHAKKAPDPMSVRLAQIGQRYLKRTLDEIPRLRVHVASATDEGGLNAVLQLAHRIHGAGATFGFHAISNIAGRLELAVETGSAFSADAADPVFLSGCHALLDSLEDEVQKAMQ